MAKKITALPAAAAAALTQLLECVTDPAGSPISEKLSLAQIKTLFDTIYQAAGSYQAAFGNQSANQVYAGPTSGGAAAPAFRALVAADLPALPVASSVQNAGTSTVTLSATPAAAIGSITLPAAGTYLLLAQFRLGFTLNFSADTTVSCIFRRTNNTAANLGNPLALLIPVYSFGAGAGTEAHYSMAMPAHLYTTAANNDAITVNGSVDAVNSGTWKIGQPWSISAIRLT